MKTWQLLRNNPELFSRYFVKEYIIKAVRKYFDERDFHELESPILTNALPQERYLDVLHSDINLRDGSTKRAYLLPSTETFNKKILVAGLGNHFVITKVFRGLEELSENHSPEFTMLEWYEVGYDYNQLMKTTEELFLQIKKTLDNKFNRDFSTKIDYQGQVIDIAGPWHRITVEEGLRKYAGVELNQIQTIEQIREVAKHKGYSVDESDDWQTIFEIIFATEVETQFPKDKPVFVYDYPRILCPLTKVKKENPNVSEKVEIYLAGKEIGNGYTELTDGEEQKKRFDEEFEARKLLGKEEIAYDKDLVDALKLGMPEVAGIGLGLDRIAMIFANAKRISEINYFPAVEMFD